jgi:putative spermidine/putrescine transport system permease protein
LGGQRAKKRANWFPSASGTAIGVGLCGFTLSYDEFARSLYTAGTFNTLPLEIYGMTTNVTTPVLYALDTVTTAVSFAVIGLALLAYTMVERRRRLGSDAGHGV